MKHGTRSRYVALRCRCKRCAKANRVYQREYWRQRYHAGLIDCHGKRLSESRPS